MRTQIRIAAGGIALLLLAASVPAFGAEGRIPIWQPVELNNVSGKFIVTRNISAAISPADMPIIKVSGGSVDIDLNGMTLTGTAGLPIILVDEAESFVLRNGTLQGPSAEAVSVKSAMVVIEDLTIVAPGSHGISVFGPMKPYMTFAIRRNHIRSVQGNAVWVDGGFT